MILNSINIGKTIMNIIRKFLLLISLCVIFVSCVANISNDNTCTKELSVNDDEYVAAN